MKNLINPSRSDPNQTASSFQNFLAGAPHGLDWKAAFTGPKLGALRQQLCPAPAAPAAPLAWDVLWAEAAEQRDRERIYPADPTSTALGTPV